jgi:peptidyl-prolyl cis-trans isomerase D
MLQAIRDRTTGWIAWFIVGLIAITFALWGVDSYLRDETTAQAARVNGVEISEAALSRTMQRQRIQMQRLLGEDFAPGMIDEALLRASALEGLIQKQLLMEMAEKEGFVISDQLLAARIQGIPDLQQDGVFSRERYEMLLRQQGMSPTGFEMDMRADLLTNQITSGFNATIGISEAELADIYALQAQQREVEYLLVSAARIAEGFEPGDEEIRRFFEANREAFHAPEDVRLEYLEISREEVAAEVPVDEEAVRAYYEQNQHAYGREEQRRARHILVQVAATADEEAVAAARERILQARERILGGEDFANVAGEVSDDPGSAGQGGDLGLFGRGMMVPEFEGAAFALAAGELSEPVRSPFGFHLIEITAIEAGDVKPLEEVRDEIVANLREFEVDTLFMDRAEILANTAYEHPGTLGVAATQLGLETRESDWISRQGGEGIGRYPGVVASAFGEEVFERGNNSDPIEVEPGRLVVVRLLDHRPARPRPLEQVRDEVVAALRDEHARTTAQQRGQTLRDRLAGGDAMETLADGDTVRYQAPVTIHRNVRNHPAAVVMEAFRMSRPEDGGSALSSLALDSGDYVVIRLNRVQDGDTSRMTDAERQQLRQGLMSLYGAAEVNALLRDLRAQAKVVIADDERR